MITCKIHQNEALVPDTAIYFAAVAVLWGYSPKHEKKLCFILESTLDKRMDELNEKNPYLTVEFTPMGRKAVISISDLGFPYIPSSNQKKALSNGIIDGFKFEQLGSEGQRISFFISLEKIFSEKKETVHHNDVLLDDKISCRLTNPDDHDILEAIRTIYSVWNYNYVHEELYKINEYRNMLNHGKYISALAKNEHAQVLGHVALEEHEWFPGIPEICGLVVRPLGQGHHISDLLMNYICEVAEKKNLKGLYGMPVTNHSKSQAGVLKLGFTPCGLYRHFTSTGNADPLVDAGNRVREGITVNSLAVKLHNDDRIHKLYLPQSCISFISRIFDEINAQYELLTPPSDINYGKPHISYQHDPINRSMGVKIENLGDGLEKNLDWVNSQAENGPVETVTVYIKMNDPTCPASFDFLTKNGYVFAGCLPGSSNGDYLILLDLNRTPIDKDKLDLHPRFKEMVDKLL